MITIHATTRVAPDSRDHFVRLAAATIAESRLEDGCVAYTCAEDIVEACTFRWVEVWRDLESFNAHAEAAHHVEFLRALGGPDGVRRDGPAEGTYLEASVLDDKARERLGFSRLSRPNASTVSS